VFFLALEMDLEDVTHRSTSSPEFVCLTEWPNVSIVLTEPWFCEGSSRMGSSLSLEDSSKIPLNEPLDWESERYILLPGTEWSLEVLVGDRQSHSGSESTSSSCSEHDACKLGIGETHCLKLLFAANCANASLGVLKGVSSSMILTSPHGC
jgi:hypothetical protein